MSHRETFDMYLDSRYLQKRTCRDRDFGCKVLMARRYRVKEECRMQNAEIIAAFFIFSAKLPTVG